MQFESAGDGVYSEDVFCPAGIEWTRSKMSDAVEKEQAEALRSTTAGPVRRWKEANKRRIAAESYQLGTSVALVARCNAVNANLAFNWRRGAGSVAASWLTLDIHGPEAKFRP